MNEDLPLEIHIRNYFCVLADTAMTKKLLGWPVGAANQPPALLNAVASAAEAFRQLEKEGYTSQVQQLLKSSAVCLDTYLEQVAKGRQLEIYSALKRSLERARPLFGKQVSGSQPVDKTQIGSSYLETAAKYTRSKTVNLPPVMEEEQRLRTPDIIILNPDGSEESEIENLVRSITAPELTAIVEEEIRLNTRDLIPVAPAAKGLPPPPPKNPYSRSSY